MVEEETNRLDISVEKDGQGNIQHMSKAVRENKDDVIQFNTCDKADEIKGNKRKEDPVD
jgi:hypothetical protein